MLGDFHSTRFLNGGCQHCQLVRLILLSMIEVLVACTAVFLKILLSCPDSILKYTRTNSPTSNYLSVQLKLDICRWFFHLLWFTSFRTASCLYQVNKMKPMCYIPRLSYSSGGYICTRVDSLGKRNLVPSSPNICTMSATLRGYVLHADAMKITI